MINNGLVFCEVDVYSSVVGGCMRLLLIGVLVLSLVLGCGDEEFIFSG